MELTLETGIAAGTTLLTLGVSWGMVRHSLRHIKEQIKELKHRKPELLEFRVELHEKQIMHLQGEFELVKHSLAKLEGNINTLDSKFDLQAERIDHLIEAIHEWKKK